MFEHDLFWIFLIYISPIVSKMNKNIFSQCILILGQILLLLIDSISDKKKDIPALYFISSIRFVMSITSLLWESLIVMRERERSESIHIYICTYRTRWSWICTKVKVPGKPYYQFHCPKENSSESKWWSLYVICIRNDATTNSR